MSQLPRSTRRQKIEPLNWAEAAQAPALKGMTSFLDVSAEDVRNGTFDSFGPRPFPSPAVKRPDPPTSPAYETYPGDETSPSGPLSFAANRADNAPIQAEPPTPARSPYFGATPAHVSYPGDETPTTFSSNAVRSRTASVRSQAERLSSVSLVAHPTSPADVSSPGGKTSLDGHITSGRALTSIEPRFQPRAGYREDSESDDSRAQPLDRNAKAEGALPVLSAGREPSFRYQSGAHVFRNEPQERDSVVPGRGRSKVRRCVLAQDGHSLGEEAIYQILWRSGRPENNDPNGSRTVRIGAADLGYKVNMAKKNVRQNISKLFEKLAVEIVEDFETMNSQARLYRVFSYKQILERRRATGLEYVLRNKGVVFCTPSGEQLVTSPAYLSTPGDETSIRPAPPKKRRTSSPVFTANQPIVLPPPVPHEESPGSDLQLVVQALNRYWPVDHAAAVQLLRECRRMRPDARGDEIAFFVREKLELARKNRNITNPTGLILATVPMSFVGSTFDEFRGRMDRQAALAEEEQQRKEREQLELSEWILNERERCETVMGDPEQAQDVRDTAEKRLRQLSAWNS